MRTRPITLAVALGVGMTIAATTAATVNAAPVDSTVTATASPARTDTAASAERDWNARLLGEQVVPKGQVVDGMPVGELSGIDYDRKHKTWYLISDDTADAPARFYTAKLDLDETGLHGVEFVKGHKILRTDGTPFPPLGTEDPEVADPESIRVDPATGSLWWSSEGARFLPPDVPKPQLVDPWVRQMDADGGHLRETFQPPQFAMSEKENGPQANGVFEGMTLSSDGRLLATSLESPLFQDGPRASRLTFYEKWTGLPIRQVAYELDDLPGNGISEILSVDRHRYLVVERNFVAGVGNSIRVYEVDVRNATNVLRDKSLADGGYRPVTKRLVVDFKDLGLPKVDNIEAVTWGPKLESGERTLVFTSDDNFNDSQISQVVALAVTP